MINLRRNKYKMKLFDDYGTPIFKGKGSLKEFDNVLKRIKKKMN